MTFNKILEDHYRKHFNTLVRQTSRVTGSRHNAEDAVQEAYCRALQYQDSYDQERPFDAWFNTILRNAIHDINHQNKSHGAMYDAAIVDIPAPDTVKHSSKLSRIRDIINSKPEEIQIILNLYFFQNYTQTDVANVTTKTRKAVEHIIRRFRQELRDELGRYT